MEFKDIVDFLNERIESTEKKQNQEIQHLLRVNERMYDGKIEAYKDVLKFVLNHPNKRH